MSKLLRAGFFKLFKSKIFYAIIIATIVIAMIMVKVAETEKTILIENLDMTLVGNVNIIAFVIVVFVIVFTGSEYSRWYY